MGYREREREREKERERERKREAERERERMTRILRPEPPATQSVSSSVD